MDYDKLYQRLWREIAANDTVLKADMQAFIRSFLLRLRSEGWRLSGDAEAVLKAYLNDVETGLKASIERAVAIGANLPLTAATLQSAAILAAAEAAFNTRWPDGLTLSKRLWRWQTETRDGIERELKAGIRQGQSVNKTLYAMQRAIERTHGDQRFKIVEQHVDDWVKDLHQSALALIHDPQAKQQWLDTMEAIREHIDTLKYSGSRHAAERVFSQIQAAVEDGREALLDSAVKWWTYDKQLFHLKRIARTEMATAMHNAVIDDSIDNPDIIGYQWRLSASHPVADICDYYANIEMGLGKGVFSKAAVPRHKAHPHCMCLLIPRTTPIAETGSKNYAQFIQNTSQQRRDLMLPAWAKQALDDGVPLAQLIRPDGFGLVSLTSAAEQSLAVWLKHPKGMFNITTVPPAVAKALGASTQQVYLSPETLAKNKQHHPDITMADYARLEALVSRPQVVVKDGARSVVVVKQAQAIYWAAIKSTATGKALFVTSFRRSNTQDVARLLRKGEVVFGDWK